MNIWLVKEGEPLPSDGENVRLFRMGILARALLARGHTVTWFSSTFNHAEKRFRTTHDEVIELEPGYTLRLLHAPGYSRNVSAARARHQRITASKFLAAAKALDPPDVILCAMPTINLSCACVRYALRYSVPVLIDIRDLWPDIYEDYVPSPARPLVRAACAYSRSRLKWALRNADGIIGLTEPYLQWGLDYAGRKKAGLDAVFPLGYADLSAQTHISAPAIEALGWNSAEFTVCFFGQIGQAADLETVVDAARLLKDEPVSFVLCGTGEKLDALKERARDLPRVFFPGWVDAAAICAVARAASAGLMPYRPSKNYEMNMPNKFAEFLSFGLPVLVQPGGLMAGIVKERACGLRYSDAASLAQAITTLKDDPALLKRFCANARALYEKALRADAVYAAMVEHLERAAGSVKE